MNIERFHESIIDNKPLYTTEIQEVRSIIEDYPYFQHGIFLYLQALYRINYNLYKDELNRLSIYVRDRRALFFFIFKDEFEGFMQKAGKTKISEDKTSTLLEAFFSDPEEEHAAIDFDISGISLASSDYFNYLIAEPESVLEEDTKTETPPLRYQKIIDTFLEKSKEGDIHIKIDKEALKEAPRVVYDDEEKGNEEVLNDDMFFTETLAKIYIKQKRYDRAHKIIKHLSLNYPKKNIYFADQLSFLEKLIINSKYKDKK